MAKVTGLKSLVSKLRAEAAKANQASAADVTVGYTQSYAIYVHENLQARHPVGMAKFLEYPARANAQVYAGLISSTVRKGKTVSQALLVAGLRLQRDSQELCPVLTGALKGSAFTRLELDG